MPKEKLVRPDLPRNHAKNIYDRKPISETLVGQVSAAIVHNHARNNIGNPIFRGQLMQETAGAADHGLLKSSRSGKAVQLFSTAVERAWLNGEER
ncbi:MAG: hypothetical protein PHY14_01245 [Candidatus Gracilibacteria bacterium]|nr:hypothetical protein [Candidatus Gracilibacteria bacterium]